MPGHALAALLLAASGPAAPPDTSAQPPKLTLAPCRPEGVDAEVRCGTYWVYENRAARRGRRIPLNVVLLPARARTPAPDPVVVFSGGPGQSTTEQAGYYWRSPLRDGRDVVLIDQRGTSAPVRLDCPLPGSAEAPGGYLETAFSPAVFRACRPALERIADLRHYTSAATVDDFDELRKALGYRTVNLYGASWGTRAILVYLRRHPRAVRSAIMLGVAPTSLRNPLPHARSAQRALDLLLDECARQAPCRAAFPNVRGELRAVLARLAAAPGRATIRAASGKPVAVRLTAAQFAEALRVMTYDPQYVAAVPKLIHAAHGGDLSAFVRVAVESNRALRRSLRFGLLMSIVCTEDVSRIRPADVAPATAGTYLGDSRVREQVAACAEWPRGAVPDGYGDPVRADVPALLISGTADPVTPPHFGAEAARHLPNGLHVVAPGSHVPAGPCIDAIQRAFLERASAAGLDTSCTRAMALPTFVVGP